LDTAKAPKITGPSFKLAKSTKYLLANETDRHRRGDLKRAMIKAQVESLKTPPAQKKGKGKEDASDA
jgi:hypothetical protein